MKIITLDGPNKIIDAPDWTKTLVIDLNNDIVALDTKSEDVNMFDSLYFNRGNSRTRRFKKKIGFNVI